MCFLISGSEYHELFVSIGAGDVFGDEFWREPSIGQSAANVRALTYSDLHVIKREKLLEVLTFYTAFANSFARNITLTYNLRVRVSRSTSREDNHLLYSTILQAKLRKIADVKREKEMEERRKNEQMVISEDHPVRKLLQRIRDRYYRRLQAPDVIPADSVS